MMKIGFLGAGKMAQALAKGFIAAGVTKGQDIAASCAPRDVDCIEAFQNLGATVTSDNTTTVKNSEVVFLAVKPFVVNDVLTEIRPIWKTSQLLLSVAMGVNLNHFENTLPKGSKVIRVMPNTAAVIGCAASVFSRGSNADSKDAQTTKHLLDSVGICEEVPESMMDAVTALSGSGPAYVYLMIEALADGGVKMGLPRNLAYKLAAQTVTGAGQTIIKTELHPGILKDNVTSPAGSTAEGLYILERYRVRAAFIDAVEIATQRCKQVNQELSKILHVSQT